MNNPMQIPGYIVQVNNLTVPNRSKYYTFRDAELITARQIAFQKAQQIVSEKHSADIIDVHIDLVEIDRTTLDKQPTVIATVFQQGFNRALFVEKGKDLLMGMELDEFTKKSLPASLFRTQQTSKASQTFESLDAIWKSLGELTCEYEYYQSYGYSMGFGNMQMNVNGPYQIVSSKDIYAMTDQEIDERLGYLKQQKKRPFSLFFLLYDSMAYAASLISQYNQNHAQEQGALSFSINYSSPQ